MIEVDGVYVSLVKGDLKFNAENATDKVKAWGRIKKHKSEILSYLKTFRKADTLADYVDGGEGAGAYKDRIKRMPELSALLLSMDTSEKAIKGFNLHDKAMTDRTVYLDCFNGLKTYQTFNDNPDKKEKSLARIIHDQNEMTRDTRITLENLNKRGAGVYLTINETDGQGRAAKNITKVRACFADLDGAPLHPVWAYDPSMVVETSPGKYHIFWLVESVKGDTFPLEGFTQMQESIAAALNSDPKVKDLPRVLRIPGFMHNKKTPFLSRIIHHSGERYSYGKLVEMFPPIKRETWSAPAYTDNSNAGNNPEFKGQLGASAGGRNSHVLSRIAGASKRGLSWPQIEEEAFREACACSPPLSEKETRSILKSFRRYV